MCIIIDANLANDLAAGSNASLPILSALTSSKLKMVCGGLLKEEIAKTKLRKLYRQLVLSGTVSEYSSIDILTEAGKIDRSQLRSNDIHVIALARLSGARILYSRDKPLHADFKNTKIVPSPKGKIYQEETQARLLKEGVCACA